MPIRRKRRRAEINIVPLIDVLTVLIFFFLMTMQFRQMTALDITPPRIETAGESRGGATVTIGIRADGALFVDGQAVTENEFVDLMEEAGALPDKPALLLLADEVSALGRTTFVMDQARKNGLEQIRLQAR